ncbi:MAG: DnaJ domain-containing protein [Bacteroidia bacterium]|nr:DnaJ domain-containing protein [Bacteroidia bacterium]MDW8159643.1 DnaJ domain-containing protein [Bacteroidia bacterium]
MAKTKKNNYYKILGVSPYASEKEIETAYHQKAKEVLSMHTDQKEFILNQLMDAYSTLKNPEKRKAYNATLGIKEKAFSFPTTEASHSPGSKLTELQKEHPTFSELLDFDFEALEERAPETPKQKTAFWDAIFFKILVFSIFLAFLVLLFWAIQD